MSRFSRQTAGILQAKTHTSLPPTWRIAWLQSESFPQFKFSKFRRVIGPTLSLRPGADHTHDVQYVAQCSPCQHRVASMLRSGIHQHCNCNMPPVPPAPGCRRLACTCRRLEPVHFAAWPLRLADPAQPSTGMMIVHRFLDQRTPYIMCWHRAWLPAHVKPSGECLSSNDEDIYSYALTQGASAVARNKRL